MNAKFVSLTILQQQEAIASVNFTFNFFLVLKVATCLNCGIKAHPVCVGLTKHQYTIDDLYTPDVFFTCEKCLDAKQNHHTKD